MLKRLLSIGILLTLIACGGTPNNPPPTVPEDEVPEQPTVTLTANQTSIELGEPVEFTATMSTHGETPTISWDFGDGTTRTDLGATATHTYAATGAYTASVTIETTGGTATAQQSVTVTEPEPETDPDPEEEPEGEPEEEPEPDLGQWRYVERVDPITDKNTSYIRAGTTAIDLVVRCHERDWELSDPELENGVEVYVATKRHLGVRDYYRVTYRVDSREPVTASWIASSNHQGAFARISVWEGYNGVHDFLQEIALGTNLIFRIAAFDGDHTYTLRVDGFRNALEKLGCYTGPEIEF